MNKGRKVLVAAVLALVLLVAFGATASPPPLPSSFYGSIAASGFSIPAGTRSPRGSAGDFKDPRGLFSGGITEVNVTIASELTLSHQVALSLFPIVFYCGTTSDCEPSKPNTFYRGTSRYAENEAFDETKNILSDAAIEAYFEQGRSLVQAYSVAFKTHQGWLEDFNGDEAQYAYAHSTRGAELEAEYGRKRTFVSVTHSYLIAKIFAGPHGRVYAAELALWELVPGAPGGSESEFLLRLGRPGFRIVTQ